MIKDKVNFNFRIIIGILKLVVFFGMGFLLLFTNIFDFNLAIKISFGVVFLLYGIFRAYKLWKYKK